MEIEVRVAYLAFNSSPQIGFLGAPLIEHGIRLFDVTGCFAALPDGYFEICREGKGA